MNDIDFTAEKVTENFELYPGQMSARNIWIAYPARRGIEGLGHQIDRISRAWGVGHTRKEALEAAALATPPAGDTT